jgi:aryl-alcohol dehydrogenase-like predicted oxidoreductase
VIEQRSLGTSGIRVPVVGLGGNNFGRAGTATESQEGTDAVIDAALEAGVTFIDTADMYGAEFGLSETRLGAALQGRRDNVAVATKFGHIQIPTALDELGSKGSRAYVRTAVADSLRRLQTDRIDLYQLHTPDESTPIEETTAALEELVQEGKILAFGHSNLDAAQIEEADAVAAASGAHRWITAQNEYNLLTRGIEREVLPTVERLGIGMLPFFPLANGLFTGKFTRTELPADTRIARQRPHVATDAPWDAIEAYAAFADERGISMLEATFGWLLAHPTISSVIAGATRPEQVRANAAAGSGWRPDAADLAAIDGFFPLT